jgi:hypothetical protein
LWDAIFGRRSRRVAAGATFRCVEGAGRAAGSPDNAHSTVFFMWNDEGTYMLKKPDGPPAQVSVRTMSPDDLIAHAERCKVKIKDGRTDFPRDFPAYAGQ